MSEPLSLDERDAIAEAVRQAEAGTAGEIRVVVVTQPLIRHPFFALMWAALIALALPWPLAFLTTLDTPALLSIQASACVVLGGVLIFTPLGRLAVPRFAREAGGRAAAVDHFLTVGMHQTRGRTGVLIMVALEEHLVEVVADEAVHAKVGPEAWEGVCAAVLDGARAGALAAGLVAGVNEAGRILAIHAPRAGDDTNELPDRVVVV